ncbi:MAG: recombinase RecT [Betaproteobacteria bacterium]|nr:recombinase RecT [Betaproteobacteria bacterium]MDE2239049.1 recombinase RecT [Rhodospirillales bacterium]
MSATTQRPQLVEARKQVAPAKPIDLIRRGLEQMAGEFAMALPQHIPVDRFKRVVLTAVNQNQDLLTADRRSLMGACMKAAQDGLYPDGREGALVIFKTKTQNADGKDVWTKAVQWMPMVYGIIKKMRNSGELASIVAHEVYEKDAFIYRLGDEESIEHTPYLGDDEPGKMIAVYSIAKLKDGTTQREVMTRKQVDKVRAVSKAGNGGPWVAWYEEMARKTVVRRLSKYLPMSTEIEDMLRRDDAFNASADTMKLSGADGVTIDAEPGDVSEAEREAEAPAIEQDKAPAVTVPTETAESNEVPAYVAEGPEELFA